MSAKFPKISIVTPCYNQAEFLESTIQSVLSQNYPNLEYIIIDCSSTDRSAEIIKKYANYLHYWCSESDQGQYHAINKGFAHSTGEIMAWLNSDDMYFPFAFKTVASIMSELENVEWLTTTSPAGWDWQGFCTGFTSISGYSKEGFLEGLYGLPGSSPWFVQQESTFWRRSLWSKIGSCIPTKFKYGGDFHLWTYFYRHADLYGTPSPLGGFRFRYNQQSRQPQYSEEVKQALAEFREAFGWRPNYGRDLLLRSQLYRIPKIGKIVRAVGGFTGKRILRQNPERPESCWKIKEYKFP